MIPKYRAWSKSRERFERIQQLVWHRDELTRVITSFKSVIHTNLPEDVILMQYTGQKDCNNSKIFDADILLEPWTGRIVGRVFYSLGNLAWKVLLVGGGEEYLSDCLDSEVCGNIHENPDLMEELGDG